MVNSGVQAVNHCEGTKVDANTGEEPGKIHHELPGVRLRNMITTYNACDTTALFLIAFVIAFACTPLSSLT